ncbi:metal-sulfur cluster biosynthetic enzyme [Rhizobium sp. BK275]|uniref:metal-sulfur cluster assembly factor n=1 Tax=unclassified Rhizobium TaxID=2613769 RepID=UPI0016176627|nr:MULTISPECIES: metal-sulfur cluster assembly factor [unclassified Rhizobium]MBB3388454.1 metal-sulfur cluster biosynthetic enzyme [Rhizobium sp. BK275]MBB3407810.1 metal-sulfur cluster biosynthetic enzyme [Rhizobium sp. BK316]
MPASEVTEQDVRNALREIEDPEMGTSIVDLGLVYEINVTEPAVVKIKMTTTTRFCPASGYIADAARQRVEDIAGVRQAVVDLVYEPAWSPDMVSLFGLPKT